MACTDFLPIFFCHGIFDKFIRAISRQSLINLLKLYKKANQKQAMQVKDAGTPAKEPDELESDSEQNETESQQ